jgi:hypothetical protein
MKGSNGSLGKFAEGCHFAGLSQSCPRPGHRPLHIGNAKLRLAKCRLGSFDPEAYGVLRTARDFAGLYRGYGDVLAGSTRIANSSKRKAIGSAFKPNRQQTQHKGKVSHSAS